MTKKTNKSSKVLGEPLFSGVVTALVTPFLRGKVDYKSLKKLVRQQLEGGVQGFVVNGTTAESPCLDSLEVEKIFKTVRQEVGKTFPLILGTGSNSTAETIKKTKLVQKWGANGALVVVPYYNKPPQRGMIAHFSAVAKSTTKPILLYNVPGRTVVSLSSQAVCELAKIKNIVGIKEASGKMENIDAIKSSVPRHFLLASGDDATCLDFITRGGHGVVSVVSHVIPKELRALCDRARAGDASAAIEYKKFENLNRLLGVESNPIPVKRMLFEMGVIASPELRLPLAELAPEYCPQVVEELKRLEIL